MKLYRKMFAAADGKPVVGDGRNMLGVRPADPARPAKASDVGASAATDKIPAGQGMSVFGELSDIPPQVQGETWVIESDDLADTLTHAQRGKKASHYHIEPADDVTLAGFQQRLANTRDLWQRVDGGQNP